MKTIKGALSTLVLLSLAECGGGGGGGGTGNPITGAVIDGYINGATVFLDVNSNGVWDTGEPKTVTSTADGSYTLQYSGSTAGMHVVAIVPVGAVDSDLGSITTAYNLLAPAESAKTVTPLTTLVSSEMIANKTTVTDAEKAVKANLNLTTDLLGYDFKKANDKDTTALAQVTAAAIASATTTLKSDPTVKTAGLTDGDILKQAAKQVKDTVLPQVVSSTGKVTVTDTTSQDAIVKQVSNTVSTTISGNVQNIVAQTKSGDGTVVDISQVFKTGLMIASKGGSYLNSSGNLIWDNTVLHIEDIKFDLSNLTTPGNWQKVLVNNAWIDETPSSEDYYFDGSTSNWVAGTSGATPAKKPTINGNCVDLPQANDGTSVLTACAVAKDLSSKAISDVTPTLCKDGSNNSISGCDPKATMPSGSIVYDFTISYKKDTYDFNVDLNWNGWSTAVQNSTNIEDLIAQFKKSESSTNNCSVGFEVLTYDSTSTPKKGTIGWRNTGLSSCDKYTQPTSPASSIYTEVTNFQIKTVGGIDLMVYENSNIYRATSGSMNAYRFFGYYKGTKKSGFWNGNYHPANTKESIPFTGNVNASAQILSPTALDFFLKQLGITKYTYPN